MKKRKWWLIGLATVVLIILGIGGKQYMDKKAIEKDYQQGIDLIQKYVSNYLVENYEGIEKIEWQGVGVEWRNAKGYGTSLLGNYVKSDVKLFISQNSYIKLHFLLTDKTEYNEELKKYVQSDVLNSENIDSMLEMEIRNANRRFNDKEKIKLQQVRKKTVKLSIPKIIYNLDIYELKY